MENKSQCHRLDGVNGMQGTRTEPLFRRVTALDDLNDTRAKRLDRRRVVGEDTHVTGRGGKVDLNHIGRGEDRLRVAQRTLSTTQKCSSMSSRTW